MQRAARCDVRSAAGATPWTATWTSWVVDVQYALRRRRGANGVLSCHVCPTRRCHGRVATLKSAPTTGLVNKPGNEQCSQLCTLRSETLSIRKIAIREGGRGGAHTVELEVKGWSFRWEIPSRDYCLSPSSCVSPPSLSSTLLCRLPNKTYLLQAKLA